MDFLPRRVESDPRSEGETDIWYNEEWTDPYFQVGMKFTRTQQFKDAIRKYVVCKGAAIKTKKNDSKRQKYICKKFCSWMILMSYDSSDHSFKVKRYHWEHNCTTEYRIKKANAAHLANHFKEKVRTNPFYRCKQIMVDCFR